MSKNQFTRQEVYDLVWSKPLRHLAEQYKFKENYWKEICTAQNIPVPPLGYWMKIEYGKQVHQTKLPIVEKEELVNLQEYRQIQTSSIPSRYHSRTQAIQDQFPKECIVPKRLTHPCPMIEMAKKDLSQRKNESWGRKDQIIQTRGSNLAIHVTWKNIARALRIFDTFIKLLRKRGHQITIENRETVVRVDEEEFMVKVREKRNRTLRENDPYPRYDFIPNGKLMIKVSRSYDHKEWMDGAKPVEKYLSNSIAYMEIQAEKRKKELAEYREIQKEQEKIRAEQARQQALKELENKKVELLSFHAEAWRKATELQNFISEVEGQSQQKPISNDAKEWLEWARAIVNTSNPLSHGIEVLVDQYRLQNMAPELMKEDDDSW